MYGPISVFAEKVLAYACTKGFGKGKNIIFRPEDFNVDFLSKSDFHRVNDFKALKKQVEWLAGRCLIKHMVFDVFKGIKEPEDVVVACEAQGAPYLKDFPSARISLTHAGDMVGAALGVQPCHIGLDIEKIKGIPDNNFMKIAFTPREIEDMRPYTPEGIFLRWTMKEAFLKYIRKGFHESLHHVEVLGGRIFYHGKPSSITTLSEVINRQYAMSFVTGNHN